MATIGSRIKQLREFKGLSQRDFCSQVGVSLGVIGNAESERNNPGASAISNIAIKYPELNVRWLLTGQGEMLSEDSVEAPRDFPEGSRLAKLSALARRGGAVQAWEVWRELSDWPEGLTKKELASSLNMDTVDLGSDLSLLEAYGLVSRAGERWKANQGQLISDDVAAGAEHRMKVVGMLLEPPVRPGRRPSRLVTAALRISPSKLEEAKARILTTIRTELEDLDEEEGELLTVILALLDANRDMS